LWDYSERGGVTGNIAIKRKTLRSRRKARPERHLQNGYRFPGWLGSDLPDGAGIVLTADGSRSVDVS
jgi:hypothetical protein